MQRLLGALTAAGHETHLFAERWQGQAEGVKFHSIQADGSRAERPLRFAEAVNAALQHERFDCVFSLERTLKQDVYRAGDGLHRVWLQRRREFAPWWKRPLVGLGAFHRNMMALEARTFDPSNTQRIIVNSEMVRAEIAQHFPDFPLERVHTIRNGVEVRRFQNLAKATARKRFGLEESDFVLVFVGSGWERKGLPWLLKFMAAHSDDPHLKLLVVTRDRMRGRISPNVILTGPLSDVQAAYAASDVLTFLPIYEPCSNVVSEALATGIPVVTTSFNGASELIDSGINGHVIDDPGDLATLGMCINFWRARGGAGPVITRLPLDLELNVDHTIQVLKLAAKNRE